MFINRCVSYLSNVLLYRVLPDVLAHQVPLEAKEIQ